MTNQCKTSRLAGFNTKPQTQANRPLSEPQQRCFHPTSEPHYALQKDRGFWQLTYGDQTAILKHEVGLDYVEYLMQHPDEFIHGLALALKVRSARAGTALQDEDIIQERALALDDAEAARRLYQKQLSLEAIVDDESTPDPVKEEVQRELLELYAFQKKTNRRASSIAYKAAHSVNMAIKRLHRNLLTVRNATGNQNPMLRRFADHIMDRVLLPSGRCVMGGARVRGLGGHFIYASLAGSQQALTLVE